MPYQIQRALEGWANSLRSGANDIAEQRRSDADFRLREAAALEGMRRFREYEQPIRERQVEEIRQVQANEDRMKKTPLNFGKQLAETAPMSDKVWFANYTDDFVTAFGENARYDPNTGYILNDAGKPVTEWDAVQNQDKIMALEAGMMHPIKALETAAEKARMSGQAPDPALVQMIERANTDKAFRANLIDDALSMRSQMLQRVGHLSPKAYGVIVKHTEMLAKEANKLRENKGWETLVNPKGYPPGVYRKNKDGKVELVAKADKEKPEQMHPMDERQLKASQEIVEAYEKALVSGTQSGMPVPDNARQEYERHKAIIRGIEEHYYGSPVQGGTAIPDDKMSQYVSEAAKLSDIELVEVLPKLQSQMDPKSFDVFMSRLKAMKEGGGGKQPSAGKGVDDIRKSLVADNPDMERVNQMAEAVSQKVGKEKAEEWRSKMTEEVSRQKGPMALEPLADLARKVGREVGIATDFLYDLFIGKPGRVLKDIDRSIQKDIYMRTSPES